MTNLIKKSLLIFTFAFLHGCGGNTNDPASDGPYSVCQYTLGWDAGYQSARVTYPCDLGDGPFSATTLTGGLTNIKEQMTWLSEHLTSHGFIVITMTPTNIFGNVDQWRRAHVAGYERLLDEDRNFFSPIYNQVNTDAINLMGFSLGGGGAVLAADELGDDVASVVGLAPVIGGLFTPSLRDIEADTLLISGALDLTANPLAVAGVYDSLPSDIDSALVFVGASTHLDLINIGFNHRRYRNYVTAWLEVYLNEDDDFETYISGPDYFRRVFQGWYFSLQDLE